MSDTQGTLTRLLLSTINAREVEAARLARTLHDEVGQVLSAVGLQLDVLKLDFKNQLPEIVERIDEMQHLLDQAVQQVRAMSYDLNPAVVERAGLQFALERLVGRLNETFAGSIRLLHETGLRVPVWLGDAWYKIAEHALENALRHSEATKIEVQIRSTKKSTSLEVRDNGKGFPAPESTESVAGLGLLLMQHYAAAAHSRLTIRSAPAKGTTLRATYHHGQGENFSKTTG